MTWTEAFIPSHPQGKSPSPPGQQARKQEVIMQQAFIPHDAAPTLADAEGQAPWAAVIVEAEGGWQAFESCTDYDTWCNQV